MNAALSGGADVVYLGYTQFSARASAANFDADSLRGAVELCHEYGVRVYVAVNTLIAPEEMDQAVTLLNSLRELGVDAVIIQDLGLLYRARSELPGLILHASTQTSLHNAAGAGWAARSGINRVIAARECKPDTLREMSRILETEAFVHGALCVSVSGQCLFSSMVGCRSGNRGQCAQPCRLPYTWTNLQKPNELKEYTGHKTSGALLSPYDQAQIDNLPALIAAGVCALKIEGRMKKPSYVYHVTKAYRRALDELAAGVSYRADGGTWRTLRRVFDRGGFSRGHTGGDEDAAIIYEAVTDHDVYAQLGEDLTVEAAADPPPIPVDMGLFAYPGAKARLTVTDGAHTVVVESEHALDRAQTPLSKDRAAAQLRKTGGTRYAARSVTADISDAHLPFSMINRLRADGLARLREARLESARPSKPAIQLFVKNNDYPSPTAPQLIARSANAADTALLNAGVDVYEWMPHDLRTDALNAGLADMPESASAERVRFVMPEFISDMGLGIVAEWLLRHSERFGGVTISNPGQLFVKYDLPLHADSTIHTFNPHASRLLFDEGCETVTLSPELTNAQIRQFPKLGGRFVVNAYGRERLMLLSHCPARAELGLKSHREACALCESGRGADGTTLTDRTGAEFPFVRLRTPDECRLRLLNCVPTDLSRAGCFGLGTSVRLTFWDEPPKRRMDIARRYADAMAGKPLLDSMDYRYTTGHARRGV
ncbi:MAG: U32 family peptidase [Oscillospiraceae bacterium]|nr:U32 family peptidase [Oscillospiraceae bacterium]